MEGTDNFKASIDDIILNTDSGSILIASHASLFISTDKTLDVGVQFNYITLETGRPIY